MQEKNTVRQTRGARTEAIDARLLLLRYRLLLVMIVATGVALGAFQLLRLLLS